MGDVVLLSGATGFLGSYIAQELMETSDAKVYALVRPQGARTPAQRLESLWCDRPTLARELGRRIVAVSADLEREDLGLGPESYEELAREVDVVIHAAALVGINETYERYWAANVRATHHMLEFALRARDQGVLRRFVFISSAYVAGTARGHIPERIFSDASYNSLYERTKHEAELLVSTYEGILPYAVVRPAQIVGDSSSGHITTFNTLYYPLKRYLSGRLRVILASPDLPVNMVPVDYVAHLAVRAASVEGAPDALVLNATGSTSELATLADLMEAVRAWARDHLRVDLPRPVFVPMPEVGALGRLRNLRRQSSPKGKGALRNLLALSPYFDERRTFANATAKALAEVPFPDWHDFLPHLLAFAVRRGFLNESGRTVAEQVLFRQRAGASTTIDYFDVTADGITHVPGTDARAEIARIAGALMAYGVTTGTRVATLGANSVRYFALNCALNLVGAIDIPIYYTSSASDVLELSEAYGAELLFVGTDRMLETLDVAALSCQVIAMGDRCDLRPGIVPWADFMAASDATLQPPYVSPHQTATIRSTSGTTGRPKGVVFDQRQLRWMGEVMPAVLDWRTRTQKTVRYLSFLPMSHVVEGILVAYAPYYILADIEMYYLNDFSALTEALPKVRPTIFFSVPRFYEKVWNQLASTGVGAFWMRLPDGMPKHLLAHPLRWAVLRKAGLDRCRQLIVGSAPMALDLLEGFRSLGIEVHNAFGVTEAPLVTLSPLGANELGSVGVPLPETEVSLSAEGEVLVRGPQVTRGYDGDPTPATDADGWFCTGDVGAYSDTGRLVLKGRRKEILVTSYGKNIAPQRIEMLLKAIDGVSEAMVVADARPFTCALVWLEEELVHGGDDGHATCDVDFDALDAAVVAANGRLSHPEQVKRWIVAIRPLTVSAAELTPNLKVRRANVLESRSELVDELYADDFETRTRPSPDVLHRGWAR